MQKERVLEALSFFLQKAKNKMSDPDKKQHEVQKGS